MSGIICHKNSLQYFSTSHLMREWVTATETYLHIFDFFPTPHSSNNKKSLLHINAYRNGRATKKIRVEWKWKFMVQRTEIFFYSFSITVRKYIISVNIFSHLTFFCSFCYAFATLFFLILFLGVIHIHRTMLMNFTVVMLRICVGGYEMAMGW